MTEYSIKPHFDNHRTETERKNEKHNLIRVDQAGR